MAPTAESQRAKPTGYDKYVSYKPFAVAVAAFVLLLLIPTPASMVDVAVEYSMGTTYVREFLSQEMFARDYDDTEQWQALTVDVLEKNMVQGALTRKVALKRTKASTDKMGVRSSESNHARYLAHVATMDDAKFLAMMQKARSLRYETLTYAKLTPAQQKSVDTSAWHIKVCMAMVAFVVVCFLTEAIPLPGVAFCIGLILVFSGIVGREEIAQLFWSDAAWFIMGSLMFAAAFVKTGVDKRICLAMFRYFAKPSVKIVTAVMILVIAPAAGFISDHALAAMFLPIAIALYSNSTNKKFPADPELAKMLVICIAMACNIGGFGSPSGGARNVILMTYLEDMFDINIGYGQWMLYGMPFVLIMMPVLWLLLHWRFKPKITDMSGALDSLRKDIVRAGPWNRKQVIAVVVFVLMLLGWILESNVLKSLLGIRLGIGVIAIAGAVAYLLFGVVNWRDYQQRVDWGVVWLYAGAIVFGRTLDGTGAAYWMARSIVEGMAGLGMNSSSALLAVGAAVTAGVTNLMADGPAAASVGPVTLNMAAVFKPGSELVPFMGLTTAAASSFAYLLIIGTPPNAIVYASGYLQPKDFLRVGLPCFVVSFIVLLLMNLLLWPAIGFPGLAPM
jgi:solute carrier family 13 (sodium-dependent dicarboxylate transporter), member 2/3/5